MNINYNPYFRSRTGNVRGMLKEVTYKLDFYHRDYVWSKENVLQFLNDLIDCFLENYRSEHKREMVANYSHYYLGEIITCTQGPYVYIIDGQHRLTTLTLLLVLLRNLQEENDIKNAVNVDKLIYSYKYGRESFNLNIEERIPYMEALYNNKPFKIDKRSISVKNIDARYKDLRENLPKKLPMDALPYFTNWLIHRVNLVEVSVAPSESSSKLFRILNDRGLPLRPVELLKGYLLENIESEERTDAEESWNNLITAINELKYGKDSDCIKNWFWSQYAQTISTSIETPILQDFERIDYEFHRWLNDERERIGLLSNGDYFRFIDNDFRFYSQQYAKIWNASRNRIPELQSVQYLEQLGAEFRFMVLMSPLKPRDSEKVVDMKIQMTAHFIEILLLRNLWNDTSIRDSVMVQPMFAITNDIRNLDLQGLKEYFTNYLEKRVYKFEQNPVFGLNKRNKQFIHWILARITHFVEVESGHESQLDKYLSKGSNGCELEHILPVYPAAANEEDMEEDILGRVMYDLKRNSIGGLILLSKSVKDKINSLPFKDKLNYYKSENLLASSLHPDFCMENPKFLKFIKSLELPFKSISAFETDSGLTDRNLLYCKVAGRIWSPDNFNKYA